MANRVRATRMALIGLVLASAAWLSNQPAAANTVSPAAVQSTPQLTISQPVYYKCFDPAWAITVTNADPNADVTLEEYKWNGTWVQTWNGVVTSTDSSGNAYWNHFGPDHGGYYYAQVWVNGQLSNPISYQVYANC